MRAGWWPEAPGGSRRSEFGDQVLVDKRPRPGRTALDATATNPATLKPLSNLAKVYVDLGEFAKAKPLLIEALERTRTVLGKNNSLTLTVMNNLARLYNLQGQDALAVPLLEESLRGFRIVLGEYHSSTLMLQNIEIFLRISSGSARSVRHTRKSGWIPISLSF